jgi:group I intron endonuclease
MYGYVYITTNLVNGKKYIGQHRSKEFDPNYKGSGKLLIKAFEKYGWDNFSTELLEECSDQESLGVRENYWINYYNAVESDKYYNILPGSFQCSGDKLLELRRNKFNGDASPWFRTKCANFNRVKALHEKYGRDTVFDNSDPDLKVKQISARRLKYKDPAFNMRSEESVMKSVNTRRFKYGSCTSQLNTKNAQENKRKTQARIFEFDNKKFVGVFELYEYIRDNYYSSISLSSVQRITNGDYVKKYESLCNNSIKVIKDRFIDPRKL